MSTFEIAMLIALIALVIALFVSMIRFLIGPYLLDRVVTFDLMTANMVGIITIYSIFTEEPLLIDIALVLSLVGFFALVAISYYLKQRNDER